MGKVGDVLKYAAKGQKRQTRRKTSENLGKCQKTLGTVGKGRKTSENLGKGRKAEKRLEKVNHLCTSLPSVFD